VDTDIQAADAEVYLLPVTTRVPLKFGAEALTFVTCVRVSLQVQDAAGRRAVGWGETPLSVQWAWPGELAYRERHDLMRDLCLLIAADWSGAGFSGHPLEVGHAFLQERLPYLVERINRGREPAAHMPRLAALVCASAFDLALHDAFGVLHGVPAYATYNRRYLNHDLSRYLTPTAGSGVSFAGTYPEDFLRPRHDELPAWHLVGGLDPVEAAELDGSEPDDGYPVLLRDWVRRDGLTCLKVKLRGTDEAWDYGRLVQVGSLAVEEGVTWLSADFNCTVTDPAYVTVILDRLLREQPRIYGMLLYVEQPFPYDLERDRLDVRSVAARKPLFMDESAHDWEMVRLGRELGWSGVALKTCKTQTGALLSLCWAHAHGMTLMVQDLTNPMLAQIPHVLLAAHAPTIMGVETNAMQFYPDASAPEAEVHPGLYRRAGGRLDLTTVTGPGFGYRLDEIDRRLPEPERAAVYREFRHDETQR